VTRDRQYAEADHAGKHFRAVDTGGFTPGSAAQLIRAVRQQAQAALEAEGGSVITDEDTPETAEDGAPADAEVGDG